jgi:prepilin-type processing-associated H-X9-DG protein/prepilin-type N-terminal cleavage/methylation domain-containing protein
MARKKTRWQRGFTLVELAVVVGIMASIPNNSYDRVKSTAYTAECKNNLSQIGKLIIMHQLENGTFPKAAFYPKDPLNGADSIMRIIGGPEKMWQCPGLPDRLRQRGLNYVYNAELGGKRAGNASKQWLLIEMNCVSHLAPHAHPGGYNVLFADGHVITTSRLPKSIQESYHQHR